MFILRRCALILLVLSLVSPVFGLTYDEARKLVETDRAGVHALFQKHRPLAESDAESAFIIALIFRAWADIIEGNVEDMSSLGPAYRYRAVFDKEKAIRVSNKRLLEFRSLAMYWFGKAAEKNHTGAISQLIAMNRDINELEEEYWASKLKENQGATLQESE